MDNCFHVLPEKVDVDQLPNSINFPFYYEPHDIAKKAARLLQLELEREQTKFKHDFGLGVINSSMPIGKMFGVLVVQNIEGRLGYLKAFSGKLGNSNHHEGFVPPVFDILAKESFFLEEEEKLNQLNLQINNLENNKDFLSAQQKLVKSKIAFESKLQEFKTKIKLNKLGRDQLRFEISKSSVEQQPLLDKLNNESRNEQLELKHLKKQFIQEIDQINKDISIWITQIENLKKERKDRSAALQNKLFDSYYFNNARSENKSLRAIFSNAVDPVPPAGAGECAAPKLFQYAFSKNYKPIAMAEFWWGASPLSEIRKHQQFYPACRGKCEPILNHMLTGLNVDPNPFFLNDNVYPHIPIIYEDEDIIVVNKPNEFLSVPGKVSQHSIFSYIQMKYPAASGPLIVHRLDMSTSGIMILALNKTSHKSLQYQFLKHKIQKKYIAILDGKPNTSNGLIDLPLRLDIDDRPRQMVCFEHGKRAITKFDVIDANENETRISFFPITGRTHQLRVHAAHVSGLNTPIKGDDLYGKKNDRLYLHAAEIIFQHPRTKASLQFKCEPDF